MTQELLNSSANTANHKLSVFRWERPPLLPESILFDLKEIRSVDDERTRSKLFTGWFEKNKDVLSRWEDAQHRNIAKFNFLIERFKRKNRDILLPVIAEFTSCHGFLSFRKGNKHIFVYNPLEVLRFQN